MRYANLTWYKDNYGSILQAYAQQELFKMIDPECVYEQLRHTGDSYSLSGKVMRLLKRGPVYAFRRIHSQLAYAEIAMRQQACADFVHKNIRESKRVFDMKQEGLVNAYYDGFVCGSDQIWNPNIHPVKAINLLSFTEHGKKRIAYAPSAGDSLDERTKDMMRKQLPHFTALSCREQEGTDMINDLLGGKPCRTVPDPTLALPKENWEEMSEKRVIPGRYIFVYLLKSGVAVRKHIEAFAKRIELPIVTIPFADAQHVEPYDTVFGDVRIAAAPDEFISLIRHAAYVFTDSFHCSVFSTLFHTPFLVYRKKWGEGQAVRIESLLDTCGFDTRFIEPETPYEVCMRRFGSFDWENSDAALEKQRGIAEEFLRKALGKEDTNI